MPKKRLSPKPFPFLRLILQMVVRIISPFTEEESEGLIDYGLSRAQFGLIRILHP